MKRAIMNKNKCDFTKEEFNFNSPNTFVINDIESSWPNPTLEKEAGEFVTFNFLNKAFKNDIGRIFFINKEIASLEKLEVLTVPQTIYKECLEQYLKEIKE